MDWNQFRTHFPVTRQGVFMDHAGVCPIPDLGLQALSQYAQSVAQGGSRNLARWSGLQEEVRRELARFIGAGPEEIAYVSCTSQGLSVVANGLMWKEGDNVIIPDLEFPSNVYPWMNLKAQGVEVRWWPSHRGRLELDRLGELLDARTRLVSVSAVQYSNGFRIDLASLASLLKEREILLCVDGIQHLGAVPMDVKKLGLDFVTADGHKWLLALEGLGFLFCDRNVMDRLHPAVVGWKSVHRALEFHRIDFTLRPDADRFEPGSLNTAGISVLGASLKLLSRVGMEQVYQRIIYLIDQLVEGLTRRGHTILSSLKEPERSGILVFTTGKRDREVFQVLKQEGITASLRGGGIRLSPHFYNNEEDIGRFFQALDQACSLVQE